MKHAELTDRIIKCFYDVYNELGAGFLESVYERALAITLGEVGLSAVTQEAITVHFRGQVVGEFRADIVVGSRVIVEVKACRRLEDVHEAQLLNYLRATEIEVGLLMNFGPKPEFKRMVFDNERKTSR